MQGVKCVVVGDKGVGKTSLLISYTLNSFPTEYIPEAIEDTSICIMVDNNTPINLQLCDNGGPGDDTKEHRAVSYPGTDVFLICFTINRRETFDSVKTKWVPEIKSRCPNTPFIIAALRIDIRSGGNYLDMPNQDLGADPVATEEGENLARNLGAAKYLECATLTAKGLTYLFHEIPRVGLRLPNPDPTHQRNERRCVVQ